MKKYLAVMAGAVLVAVMPARASFYTDVDWMSTTVTAGGAALNGNFNIVTGDGDLGDIAGFNRSLEEVVGGVATFLIVDDSLFDGAEEIRVSLDGSQVYQGGGILPLIPVTFTFGTLSGSLIASLNDDGKIDYSVSATKGDFVVKSAALAVTTRAVPDGGTSCALLGLGLCALAAISRRLRKV